MTTSEPAAQTESPGRLCRLVYVSNSSLEVDEHDVDYEIEYILHKARATNEQIGVTGVLLHSEKRFAQVLEGREEVVRKLFGQIRHDWRHERVRLVGFDPIEHRTFGSWAMAYAGRHTATAARFALLVDREPDADGEIGSDEVFELLADHMRES